jgi:hypothetical protein
MFGRTSNKYPKRKNSVKQFPNPSPPPLTKGRRRSFSPFSKGMQGHDSNSLDPDVEIWYDIYKKELAKR